MIYITGDKHGDWSWLPKFCEENQTSIKKDKLICLGDAGLNYYLDNKDRRAKAIVSKCDIQVICIHGNHEARPQTIPSYEKVIFHCGWAWNEPEFPNIYFLEDGGLYTMQGYRFLVLGGAYSIDKEYRILNKAHWFPDEQMSIQDMDTFLSVKLPKIEHVDWVLSHTAPIDCEPVDRFIPFVDQSKVDKRTEKFLAEVKTKFTDYEKWFCGHYHFDEEREVHFLFNDILSFPKKTKV